MLKLSVEHERIFLIFLRSFGLVTFFNKQFAKEEKKQMSEKRTEENRIGKRMLVRSRGILSLYIFRSGLFQDHLTHSSYDGFAHEDVSLCGPFCAYCWGPKFRRMSAPVSLSGRCFSRILTGRGAKIWYVFRIFRTLMKRKKARPTVPIRRFPSLIFSLLCRKQRNRVSSRVFCSPLRVS